MGMKITTEQNSQAVSDSISFVTSKFGDIGVTAEAGKHNNGHGYEYLKLTVPSEHILTVSKSLKFDLGVNYCSMVTGTHYPDGPAEKGWEVAYHLARMPVVNPVPNTDIVHKAESLTGHDIPLEVEVIVDLPNNDDPRVQSVQSVWVGADWNEKETWDLVGIKFDGHENMFRVLNPHDSPDGFHPLQKQHKIRYHDFNEMYDDAQGFVRKPADEGRVK